MGGGVTPYGGEVVLQELGGQYQGGGGEATNEQEAALGSQLTTF